VRVRRRSLLAGLLLACAAVPQAQAQAEMPQKPRRVASINLSADEVLVAILPAERLVSVTRWADAPGTSNVVGRVPPAVHRFMKADLEQLVALRPDLVVVSEYTDADFMKQVERSGLRVHRMLGLSTLAGVRGAILDLGRAVGEDEAARRLVAGFDATLAELSRRLAGASKPRVLYWSGNMTAGQDTAIGALIEAAGATNVGREMGIVGIAPPGAERAFVTNPEALLVGTWPGSKEALTGHPLFSQWAAVREGRILAMRTELLVALSQFTADAAWELAHLLHPDRVPASPGPQP
jgi:iron complex transport system substrate-binding protein